MALRHFFHLSITGGFPLSRQEEEYKTLIILKNIPKTTLFFLFSIFLFWKLEARRFPIHSEVKVPEIKEIPVNYRHLFGEKIPLNDADALLLETLPGVGPGLAGRIIEYREKHGPFSQNEDLMKVRGVGEKLYTKIRSQLVEIQSSVQ